MQNERQYPLSSTGSALSHTDPNEVLLDLTRKGQFQHDVKDKQVLQNILTTEDDAKIKAIYSWINSITQVLNIKSFFTL